MLCYVTILVFYKWWKWCGIVNKLLNEKKTSHDWKSRESMSLKVYQVSTSQVLKSRKGMIYYRRHYNVYENAAVYMWTQHNSNQLLSSSSSLSICVTELHILVVRTRTRVLSNNILKSKSKDSLLGIQDSVSFHIHFTFHIDNPQFNEFIKNSL